MSKTIDDVTSASVSGAPNADGTVPKYVFIALGRVGSFDNPVPCDDHMKLNTQEQRDAAFRALQALGVFKSFEGRPVCRGVCFETPQCGLLGGRISYTPPNNIEDELWKISDQYFKIERRLADVNKWLGRPAPTRPPMGGVGDDSVNINGMTEDETIAAFVFFRAGLPKIHAALDEAYAALLLAAPKSEERRCDGVASLSDCDNGDGEWTEVHVGGENIADLFDGMDGHRVEAVVIDHGPAQAVGAGAVGGTDDDGEADGD